LRDCLPPELTACAGEPQRWEWTHRFIGEEDCAGCPDLLQIDLHFVLFSRLGLQMQVQNFRTQHTASTVLPTHAYSSLYPNSRVLPTHYYRTGTLVTRTGVV